MQNKRKCESKKEQWSTEADQKWNPTYVRTSLEKRTDVGENMCTHRKPLGRPT